MLKHAMKTETQIGQIGKPHCHGRCFRCWVLELAKTTLAGICFKSCNASLIAHFNIIFNFLRDPGYYLEGFLTAQKAIDFGLINEFNSGVNKVSVEMKRFSYPPYDDDNFIILIIGM